MHFHWKVALAEKIRSSAQSDIWVVSEMVSILFTLPHRATAAATLRGNPANELKVPLISFLFYALQGQY